MKSSIISLPLAQNSKKPLAGCDWRNRFSDDPAVVQRWRREGLNVGLPLAENRLVVLDFDNKDAARAFCRKHPDLSTFIVETRRGAHFYFDGSTQTRKFPHGDIKGNGYVVYPDSVVAGWQYRFARQGPLQPFPESLFPATPAPTGSARVGGSIRTAEIKNIQAYIRKIFSIQGQHGSDACFRTACILRDAGLSQADALAELIEWNVTNAQPPWSVRELAHKVTDAYSKILKGS